MGWQDDKQRRIDTAQARAIRAEQLEVRKRTAFRILDAGGTVADAAKAGHASPVTVKKWAKERSRG